MRRTSWKWAYALWQSLLDFAEAEGSQNERRAQEVPVTPLDEMDSENKIGQNCYEKTK